MEYNEVIPLYAEKFYAYVGPVTRSGCREWKSYVDVDGYGSFQFRHEGKKYKLRAHRAAYILAGNHLPPAAVLRHSCDNPACVNIEHLLLGTHADNVMDRVVRGRGACGAERTPRPVGRRHLVASARCRCLRSRTGSGIRGG